MIMTDIYKLYVPQGCVDQVGLQGKIQDEFLRVLQNTATFSVEKEKNLKHKNLV